MERKKENRTGELLNEGKVWNLTPDELSSVIGGNCERHYMYIKIDGKWCLVEIE